jgi:hypothetical protein
VRAAMMTSAANRVITRTFYIHHRCAHGQYEAPQQLAQSGRRPLNRLLIQKQQPSAVCSFDHIDASFN